MPGHITPLVAAIWTVFSASFLAGSFGLNSRAIFAIAFLLLVLTAARSARAFWFVLKWIGPFILPIILIHGIINPLYPTTQVILQYIPIRESGFIFGLSVGINFMIISILASAWAEVDRDLLVDDLSRMALPAWFVVLATQSVAIANLIRMRVEVVYLAQRARGIAVGPGFLARVLALPSVILPVVISTLSDADTRATALASRGFGTTRLRPISERSFKTSEFVWAAAVGLAAAASLAFEHI